MTLNPSPARRPESGSGTIGVGHQEDMQVYLQGMNARYGRLTRISIGQLYNL